MKRTIRYSVEFEVRNYIILITMICIVFLGGGNGTSIGKITSFMHDWYLAGMDKLVNDSCKQRAECFIAPSSLSTQDMVSGKHLHTGKSAALQKLM